MELNHPRRRNKNSRENAPKSTPRDGYLLERERIKSEIGDLEQIRQGLGLSQRKLCQLLLVDPSAWTRWLNSENGAPPHIYQALRWLIELKKVNPDAAAPSDIGSRVDFIHNSTQAKIRSLEENVAMLERALSLNATAQPAPLQYLPADPDSTLADEVADLKEQLAKLLTAKASPPKTRRANLKKKRRKPVRKSSKKRLKLKAKMPPKKRLSLKTNQKRRFKPMRRGRSKKKKASNF